MRKNAMYIVNFFYHSENYLYRTNVANPHHFRIQSVTNTHADGQIILCAILGYFPHGQIQDCQFFLALGLG